MYVCGRTGVDVRVYGRIHVSCLSGYLRYLCKCVCTPVCVSTYLRQGDEMSLFFCTYVCGRRVVVSLSPVCVCVRAHMHEEKPHSTFAALSSLPNHPVIRDR